MAYGDLIWQSFLFFTCLVSMLATLNILSILPINMQEFDTIPPEVQKEISDEVRNRLSQYKARLDAHGIKLPRQDLMMHLNPQMCRKGEKPPNKGSWPYEMNQYFCASEHITDWCLTNLRIYQTTENVYPLSNGKEMHVSLSCYRTRIYYRYLDDMNTPICIMTIISISIVVHSWWANYLRNHENFNEERQNSPRIPDPSPTSSPSPPSGPVLRSHKAKTTTPVAPRANIRSRHDNYRNRKY